MPVYQVDHAGKKRMVKASTSAGARNHVLKDAATVKMLDAEEAVALAAEGIKMETAGEEAPPASDSGQSAE